MFCEALRLYFLKYCCVEISDNEIDALDLFQVRLSEELDYNAVLRGLVREKIFTKTINFEVRYITGHIGRPWLDIF